MTSGGSPFSRLDTVPVTGSTQDDLRAALLGSERDSWPHLSALRALRQTAGRGRSGRAWVTPDDGGALLVSVVLRPLVPAECLSWLPLLGGLAVRDALAPLVEDLPWRVGTKWPNDVVALPDEPAAVPEVPGWAGARKIAGVLSELVTPGSAERTAARGLAPDAVPADRSEAPMVILGIGVNIGQTAEELPVAWAGSLRTLGAVGAGRGPAPADAAESVLTAIGHQLARIIGQWEQVGGDVDAADAADAALGRRLRAALTTLGERVSVQAPDGELGGLAVDVTPALVLRTEAGDTEVRAGDVTLVRVEG